MIKCISRLFLGCMSLGFIARGMDWQRHLLGYPGNSSCITGRFSVIRVCWASFEAWLLGRRTNDCIWLAKIPPLLCIEIGR
jgi:hypothetical protein